jgi:hypothetical protein
MIAHPSIRLLYTAVVYGCYSGGTHLHARPSLAHGGAITRAAMTAPADLVHPSNLMAGPIFVTRTEESSTERCNVGRRSSLVK